MSRAVAGSALFGYAAVLAAITLGSSPQAALSWLTAAVHRHTGLYELTRGDVERAANVLLFIPAGLLLCYLLPRTSRWLVWLLCLVASAGVEGVQLFLPSRESTLVDVATNGTGAAIGVLLHLALTSRHMPGQELPKRQS